MALTLGIYAIQTMLFIFQSMQAGDTLLYMPWYMSLTVGSYIGPYVSRKYQADKNTVRSLKLFLYLSTLLTGLNLIHCILPYILKEVLFGFLMGMISRNETCGEIYNTIKGCLCVSLYLSLLLPIPIVESLTILTPRPKLLGYGMAAYCAFFTSILFYQLQSRPIGDYAQEIDAITEEQSIEKANSKSSGELSDTKRAELRKNARKAIWKAIGLLVLFVLYSSVIPVIVLIRKKRS